MRSRSRPSFGKLGVLVLSLLLSAPVLSECTNVSVTAFDVEFGVYNTLRNAPTEIAGRVQVTCSEANLLDVAQFEVQLSPSQTVGLPNRELANGNHKLQYNLYLDPLHQIVWGDGSSGTSALPVTLPLLLLPVVESFTIHGRIEPRQLVPSGEYSDSIVVTVLF